ncbi:MAG: NAD(P)-dependent oxidoreductase [Steroidobacteraceae bacterium]|nr:NAD(P)-dependent oxidoreductase [Steroidobacteraceae bacterium]
MASKDRIGFVGLGNMGAPMARRLAAAGYALTVADALPEVEQRFAAEVNCERAASLAALGERCQVVITMLPNGAIVREVLLGTNGIAHRLAAGSVVVDMSSSSPIGTRELFADLAKLGIPLVDAPVSGGVKKAADGTLAIMVGGDPEPIARVRPVLEVMGKVFLTGASGTGHAMKALNNFLSAANLAVAAEAVIAGERFGLNPATMIDILNASTGRNTGTDSKFPNNVLPRTFNSGFALGLMAKDLRLALEVARSSGAPASLLEMCSQIWSNAEQQLGAKADNTEVVKYLESLVPPRPAGSGGRHA